MHDDEDAFLRDTLKGLDRHIDDAGFTARVMDQLPPRSSRRSVAPVVAAVIASLLGMLAPPVRTAVMQTLVELSSGWMEGGVTLASVVVLGMLVWGAIGVAVAGHER